MCQREAKERKGAVALTSEMEKCDSPSVIQNIPFFFFSFIEEKKKQKEELF